MKRLFLLLIVIGATHELRSQNPGPDEFRTIIYPVNIPYLFFDRYLASAQLKITKVDHVLVGLRYNRQLNNTIGKGGGFEFQYRINANRDDNVRFNTHNYWGPYFEYDWLKYEYSWDPSGFTQSTKRTNIGMLYGHNFGTKSWLVIDIHYGVGVAFNTNNHGYGTYQDVHPFFKAAFQLGVGF